VTYFSLDLEKGEANATPDIVQSVAYYLLTRGWVDEENNIRFSSTWAYFLTRIVPACVCDNIAIFLNMQLRFPGQASGNTWTFLINHFVTTKLRDAWLKAGTPRPGSEQWDAITKRTGVNIKVEQETPDFLSLYNKVIGSTPNTGLLQDPQVDDSIDPLGESYLVEALPRLPLDLLGYDAVYSHELKRFIPVLAADRFRPSAVWPRKTEKDLKVGLQFHLYSLIRYETLRIMGGWTDPLVDQALENLCSNIRGVIEGRSARINEQTILNGDDLAPDLGSAIKEIDPEFSFNKDFKLTKELLMRLNTPKNTNPEHQPKRPNRRSYTRDALRESKAAIIRDLKSLKRTDWSELPPANYLKNKINSALSSKGAMPVLMRLVGDYAKVRDDLLSIDPSTRIGSEAVVETLTAAMKKVEAIEERLEMEMNDAVKAITNHIGDPLSINSFYEKDETKMANPLGYKGATKHINKNVYPSTSGEYLSKSQKKNAKKRAAINRLRDAVGFQRDA